MSEVTITADVKKNSDGKEHKKLIDWTQILVEDGNNSVIKSLKMEIEAGGIVSVFVEKYLNEDVEHGEPLTEVIEYFAVAPIKLDMVACEKKI